MGRRGFTSTRFDGSSKFTLGTSYVPSLKGTVVSLWKQVCSWLAIMGRWVTKMHFHHFRSAPLCTGHELCLHHFHYTGTILAGSKHAGSSSQGPNSVMSVLPPVQSNEGVHITQHSRFRILYFLLHSICTREPGHVMITQTNALK
jgi:hypothetical protein